MFTALEQHSIDLVILDLMLQGEDGLSLCRRLRATSHVPVIMLTAMGDHTDRVVGLEVGADDYLTKPFDQREFAGACQGGTAPDGGRRYRRDVRRHAAALCFADWRLDVTRRELRSANNTLVVLSGGEFDLLLAFAEHPQEGSHARAVA